MSLNYNKKVLPKAISFVKRELAQRQREAVIHSSTPSVTLGERNSVHWEWLSHALEAVTEPSVSTPASAGNGGQGKPSAA